MKAGYRVIDHTADKALEVWATDMGQLIFQAACGLISLLVEADRLAPQQEVEISVFADDPTVLLHDALSEMLHLVEDEGLVPLTARLVSHAEGRIVLAVGVIGIATAQGHMGGIVKAVTYHNLEIRQTCRGLRTEVVFDT